MRAPQHVDESERTSIRHPCITKLQPSTEVLTLMSDFLICWDYCMSTWVKGSLKMLKMFQKGRTRCSVWSLPKPAGEKK